MRLRDVIKSTLSASGWYRILRRRNRLNGRRLLILMYHDLAPDTEAKSLSTILRDRITASQFDAHLAAAKKAARVMTVADAVAEIRQRGLLFEDTVCITFDDGYRAVYDIAYPRLRKHGLPATVFLTTGWLNGAASLWWEELACMVERCDPTLLDMPTITRIVGGPDDRITGLRVGSVPWRATLFSLLSEHLRHLSSADVEEEMAELRTVLGEAPGDMLAQPLDWAQAGEMAGHGMTFASHTVTHINLSHADENAMESEIVGARYEIVNRLGSADPGFAYTYGQDVAAYKRIERILNRNGFDYACTATPGVNDESSGRFALCRETLPATTSRLLLEREIVLDLCERASH